MDAWAGSEVRGGEAEYARGGSLPDAVDGRSVVLGAEDLAGVSEQGRAALGAFVAATGVAARPRLVDVDGANVMAFVRMLDWWGVADHALVMKRWKTTWIPRSFVSDLHGRVLVEEGTEAWYVMGEYAPGERPDSATRLEDLWDPLAQGPADEMWRVPRHLDPDGELPPNTWLENSGESVEFFVHVVDPAGVRVEYGLADPMLWRRGREAEWGELFAALNDERPAGLMNLVNPGVRRSQYLAQAWGVDETTARVWRMWSHLPKEWHVEALRRAVTGSVVSTYGGREEVKGLVEALVPDGERYQQRVRVLGEIMMRLADRRRRLERGGEEGRDTRSAAEYRAELREEVARLGGLDQVVRAGSKPDIQVPVRELGDPAPQRAGEPGRQPSRRKLKVLHELAQALDGRELDYLRRFFGEDWQISRVTGGNVREWRRGRPGDRAVLRGIVLDTIVEAFGGPEAAVAVADRLRELGPLRGLQVFSQGQPEGPSTAARTVLSLPFLQEWWAWTLGDVVDYVAGGAVPAEVPDEEMVRHLGTARAAELTSVSESTAQEWLDGRGQPDPTHLRLMREATRLPSSELVRYLGPGRAIELTGADAVSLVWGWWLGGNGKPYADEAGELRRAVLGAITEGLLRSPQPLRRVVWSENGIREAERRLAWADATKGGEFPSGALSQWKKVNNPHPPLRPEAREVIDGLGKSLKASVQYIVVQVLLGNADARAMLEGSGFVIPDPGPGAATGLLEQIADHLRAARGMLDSGVLRRVVGGAASTRFQAATGGVVPQLRLTSGPDTVRKFMQQTAADDVHFLVLKVPSGASQDAVRAEYVKGEDADVFLASGGFFGGGQAHYFLDAVQGDVRRIDPDSTVWPEVLADAGADVAWWARHGGLRASAQGSDGGGFAAPVSRGEGSQSRAADIAKILGGPEQVAWLDGRLPRVAELLDLPESERLERLGNLAGIAELAELAGRMERHLEAMPPGFDPDGQHASNVERAKRMVRQGAWTTKDLRTVEDRLPAMREVEKTWRALARSLRRAPGPVPWVEVIRAGIVSSDVGADVRAAVRELPLRDGQFVVAVRGDGAGGVAVDARTLAGVIRQSSNWDPDAVVWLYACEVSEVFARALDEELGSRVRWTRDMVWFGPGTGGFASMVAYAYVGEGGRLLPVLPPNGRWESTRPDGDGQQGPYDLRLPEDQNGLRPDWVHLRAPVDDDVDSAPVSFGELMPLRDPVDAWEWAGSELRGGAAEYAPGGSLPDVVDGRSVVLGAEELAGVSEQGRAALGAFVAATGVAARARLVDVDGANVVAFVRMLDWWGVVDHALVVKRRKTTWKTRSFLPALHGRVLVEKGTEAWYVMGEYAPGERPDSATRPEDLWDPLTQGSAEELGTVPPHLDPDGVLALGAWLVNSGESVEFFVHVVDPAGVRVEYGLADQGLWRRGREAEWGGLFAALNDEGPAELMNLVNPGVRRSQYLAQALGVDETTAHVWRMWSHLPEGGHVEALRRAVTGSVVSTYGGRAEVKGLVEALVPGGVGYQQRLRVLGEIMMRLADRRRLLERWGEEGRDTRSAAEYRAELREEVARLGRLDQVVLTGRKPDIQVPVREREFGGPAPQRADELGGQPSPWELNVLHELAQALDGREIDYLRRFFGTDSLVGVAIGDLYEWRRSDRTMLRGVVLDTIVEAFGGPEAAVAVADRLRELGPLRGLQVFSQGQPEGPSNAARTVLSLPTMQEWGAWTLGDVVDYVAGNAVPADAPDEEVVRHLGAARAAELTSVDESRAQAWLDGSGQPFSFQLRGMREAARLPSSELVRYLGPGRAIEVTGGVVSERGVWAWLEGASAPRAEDAGRLRGAVLGAITEGLLWWPQPLRRVVWSENGIREAERRLAWADATKGGEFPSDARAQWEKVNNLDPPLRPEAREVIDGLGKSLTASVRYIVVQVLLGNADARAMLEGSGIVIPGPGPWAVTGLVEQIADHLRAAGGMLDSGVLRRVVGGAASERFQAATGGVVPQLRLTSGPYAVREFMKKMAAADDVHFLVLKVPSAASQDAVRAEYVKGNDASAFLTSGGFFEGGQAHYFLDAVQGDVRRIDPDSTVLPEVMADAGADVAWWARHGGLRASAQGSDGGGFAAPVSRGEGSQSRAADIVLGGPEQVAWLDGRLPRVAELLDLPESERLERLGNLAGIAELAELAGRMERHLKAMPPGFDPDGQRASNVERAKRMVRQGAWTATDLRTVEDRLPAMREVEKIWRDLARSLRRAAGPVPWVEVIRAGIVSSDVGADVRAAVRELPLRDGRFVVAVRGDGAGGVVVDGRSVDARTLAGVIRQSSNWDPDAVKSVWLYACEVSEVFARALDEELGSRVRWTRGMVWFGPGTGGFASMVAGAYLDEGGRLLPVLPPNGRWESTRPDGDGQPGPYDLRLPEDQSGLRPDWVHLRAPVDDDVDSALVSFGELMPLRDPVDAWEWAGSELRGGAAEYARGSLPDVVDGRSVVLGAEDLAGVSEQGRAALGAFVAATGVAARPRFADVVDGANVVAFLRMLDWWGVVDHALVVKRRKTTWRTRRVRPSDPESRELVEEGTEAWYVMGEYAPGERPDSATRPEDLWDRLTQGPAEDMETVPPHLDPDGELPPSTWLLNSGESVEFFVHVVDPAGVRVEYGPADQRLWRRGREVEWGGLFAALNDEGPAGLMNLVNPGVHRNRYLAQALGVDETTAQVWRMWSHLPEEWHAEALRRAVTGSVVSTYGGRAEVKGLVEALVPDGAGYQQRLRALGELMMPQTDRRLLEEWGEEGRDTRSAAEYRAELREEVAGLGGLDRVVRAGSRPDVQVEVRDLGGPAPQHAGELGRRPSPRQLNVLHELAQALDGDELGYLSRFFGGTFEVARAVGVSERDVREWRRGRPGDRAVVRGIVLDTIVEAFGGPEAAVAVADRLRELGPLRGLQVFSQRQPEGPSTAARTVLSLPFLQEWWAWTLGDVVDYVAGRAVPAEVPDEEVVRHLGAARAAELTSVDESRAQAWLDGSDHDQPFPFQLRGMREAARLPSSELVRYLGPGRAIEVTGGVVSERGVWAWLEGASAPPLEVAGRLRGAVLGAITEGLLRWSQPLRRVVWSENGIREAERRLAWADATKGGEFPSGARSQWLKVIGAVRRREAREVIDGLGKSLTASVRYIVVQVLLGNADARAMLEGSGIVIPDPGPWAVTGLVEQIADHLRAAGGMLDSGVLRRVVGGAASERFQAATGGVVPQLRLTGGPYAVGEFMKTMAAAGDVHFLVLKVPSGASQDVVRAEYVKGEDAGAFLASGGFFEGGEAHYFLDAVQGDVRRIDPDSTVWPEVLADAGAELAWWARHGGLHVPTQGSDGGGSAAPVWRGEGSQSRAADIAKILGGPEQVAWLDGRLPRVLHLPESVRLERLGDLAGIAEVAELAGRMEQHLEAMPPGFDPDRKHARNVEAAKRKVRQGAWTAEDLKWVKDKLPGMRVVEEKWRGLARSLRSGAADRELRVLSDRADAGLAELPGPARDSVLDAEPSPGTPAGDAHVIPAIGKAEGDEFDTFMEKEQPGLLDRLERVGGKEVPSESSTRSTGSVVDGDAVSTGDNGARRRQAWPGVGTDQGNFTDGGARSIGDSSSSDSGSSSPGRWSRSDLDREIARAKRLDLSSGERDAAGLVVRRAHDVGGLARADAVVPLEDVVALVAAKSREVGDDQQDRVVEFSRALADRLGTQGSGLRIRAGAGPAQPSDVESAPVSFGELMPLRDPVDAWAGSELRGGGVEYARGSLPDVVDGRSVVLGVEDLAGVSEQGRAALGAFVAATGVAARPRLASVDGHNVMAFVRMLDWWGVVDHALVVKRWKTTWRTRSSVPGLHGRELVEEGTDAWYVKGEYAQGERPDSATRPEDLRDPLTQGAAEELGTVPPHLDPDGELPPRTRLENIGESVEFFVHVVDPAGVRVEYALADQGLWRRGREVEWGGLFAALNDEGPAELMNLVNPGVRRSQYLAQALGVDETTAQVWRMWSHRPEGRHVEALRRAVTGSVVSTYGGRAEVKSLVEALVPDGAGYQQRVRVLGEIMMRLADRRRLLERWGEEGRDTRSAAEYRAELREEVAGLGGLDQVVLTGSRPDIQVPVRELGGPAPQRAGELGRRPSRRELNVLHELAQALDGREIDYLRSFFGTDSLVGVAIGGLYEWRRSDRAMLRGVVLDTVVEAFGGPEAAVAVADRLRELGPLRGLQVFSQGQSEGPSTAARTVLSLPFLQEWWAWTLGDVVDYVAGKAVPAEVPDEEVVRYLGPARAAELTSVSESTAQVWLDGRGQPSAAHLRLMREAARLPRSEELVRYLGPGRALEVTDSVYFLQDESAVWAWLAGLIVPYAGDVARLCRAVLGAIAEGLLRWPQPLRRVVWSENGIREAERRLAWADATKGGEFPSGALSQWKKVNNPDPPLRPEAREVIDGLERSLKASVEYIVVQVLLGNADARAMLEGSGIVIPDPGPGAATGLLEQIADHLRAARGMLDSRVLRRVVGGTASERFQAATGGVVPQLRLTRGPDAVGEIMKKMAADDVHFLVLKVPSGASQDAVRAEYVKGEDAEAFLASGGFFEGEQAHYFLDAVQGDVRRIDPDSTVPPDVLADAGADVAWWIQHGGLRASAGGSRGGGFAATVSRGEGSQPTAADIILGGPEQVAWRDGRLPRVLHLPESVRLERFGSLAGIAEFAELAGRMERHLEAMPPGFDPDGQRAANVERAKRMVRQGAWTATDLRTVEDRLPAMRELEKTWRDLASRNGRTNNA